MVARRTVIVFRISSGPRFDPGSGELFGCRRSGQRAVLLIFLLTGPISSTFSSTFTLLVVTSEIIHEFWSPQMTLFTPASVLKVASAGVQVAPAFHRTVVLLQKTSPIISFLI